jgi:hypothetical protein
MANPTVDKLKVFGLHHGEKVAMGIVAVIFGYCAYSAWSHPSLTLTADDIKNTTTLATSNIQKTPKTDVIVAKLEETGIKLANFDKKVQDLQSGTVDSAQYALANTFVKPEPGAGLIRDMPELIAPEKIYVHSGRGAVRVLALNEDEEVVRQEVKEEKAPTARRRPRASGGGGLNGMFGGSTKKKKKTGALSAAQAKKEEEDAAALKAKALAGAADVAAEAPKEDPSANLVTNAADAKKELHGFRVVTIVGKFDHKKQKEKYSKALKVDLASANPNYLRLDIERQEQETDGSWTEWGKVDRNVQKKINAVLTEVEQEQVPPEAIIPTLVDRLPYWEVGYWVGAHHAALVPKEKLKPKETASKAATAKKDRNMSISRGTSQQMTKEGYEKAGGGMSSADYSNAMGAESGIAVIGGPSGGGKAGRAGGAAEDFAKSSADWIMVRALDFDIEPDATYRYRVRIVVANPNLGWESVAPGVDTKTKELEGPWSEATDEVGVPPDVSTYAMRKAPSPNDMKTDKVEFQVVKWNEADGLTIVKTFENAPGQIVGQKDNALVPNEKKDNVVAKSIDFTSHQVLADAMGGSRPSSSLQGLGVSTFETPALAMLVRPDGILVVRDQAKDYSSGERDEMKDIYDKIVAEAKVPSKKKKGNSSMSNMYGASPYGNMGGGSGGRPGGAR